jgi:hypothetical protein
MRTKFWIIGSFVAASCLFTACGDDKEDGTVKSIVVTPATVSPLEVGGTVELTAVITPTDATEAIKWVSEDPDIVSVPENGTKATITGVKPGTTNVYATNQAGIVASNKIAVTVNAVDYAGPVLGNYVGSGSVAVSVGGMFNQPLSDVQITVAKAGDEKAKVNLTLIANVNMGAGPTPLPLVANEIELSPGTGGKLTLNGRTVALEALEGLWFTVTGEFDPVAKTLSLVLVDEGPAALKIVLEATKAN